VKTQLYLTPADHGRRLTLEEFESADALEGYHYELIHGKLEVSPIPNMSHEDLRDWLRELLAEYGRQHPEVINYLKAPARVFVPGEAEVTAPEPDLAVYCDFPLELPLAQRNWRDYSPILVVEIISPDSADKDLERNLALYLRVPSIREYWIVDPRQSADEPSLIVQRRRGQRWQRAIHVSAGGAYTTRLLPDFTLVLDPHRQRPSSRPAGEALKANEAPPARPGGVAGT
jgi:Uma2 family endonuclease